MYIGNLSSKNKVPPSNERIFEYSVNYLLSTDKHSKLVVHEIVESCKGGSDAIKQLVKLEKSFFFPKSISRVQTYLLYIYYLKNNKDIPNLKELNSWLATLLEPHSVYNIEQKYLQEINIARDPATSSRIISFTTNYPTIKLDKYTNQQVCTAQAAYTTKADKFINDGEKLYTHVDNLCLGAINLWLISTLEAYSQTGKTRHNTKQEYLKSLLLTEHGLPFNSLSKIIKLQNLLFLPAPFHYQYDIESTSSTLINELLPLIDLMVTDNNTSELYVQMLSHEHAVGFALIKKGGLIKIFCNDPFNRDNPPIKLHVNPGKNYQQVQQELTEMIAYLKAASSTEPFMLRVYTGNNEVIPKPITQNYITENNQHDWLRLGLVTENKDLIIQMLNQGANIDNAYIIAVNSNNIDLVKILLDHGSHLNINYIDKDGHTALDYAIFKKNVTLFNLLLPFSDLSIEKYQQSLLQNAKQFGADQAIIKQLTERTNHAKLKK